MDVFAAYRLVDDSIDRIQRCRNNVNKLFEEIYKEAEDLCQKVDGIVKMPRTASRQSHRENTPAETVEDYYRKSVHIPFLDHLLEQTKKRFENRTCSQIFALVPSVIVKLTDEELLASCNSLLFWEVDMPSPSNLKGEVREWRQKWSRTSEVAPANLIECLACADPDLYPNLSVLLRIGVTLPVGSVGAERSFSCLRRVKTYLRCRMSEERLSGLCLMNMHPDIPVNTATILDNFTIRNKRRMELSPILYD